MPPSTSVPTPDLVNDQKSLLLGGLGIALPTTSVIASAIVCVSPRPGANANAPAPCRKKPEPAATPEAAPGPAMTVLPETDPLPRIVTTAPPITKTAPPKPAPPPPWGPRLSP